MTKAVETIACPACGTELTLEHLVGSLDDERAFTRLVALSVPMAHLVVQYLALFAPEKQRLTLRKKVRIIQQLLPDLQRQAITHKGRDWPAPLDSWGKGIEQMLAARSAGRLQLPMTGHGYLYAILAGLADKVEGDAEEQREAELRSAGRAHSSAAPTQIADLIASQVRPATSTEQAPRPAAAAPTPAGTSPLVRAMRAQLNFQRKGTS